MNSEENEKIRKVELMAQIKMIETGVSKKDAYVYMIMDLTKKPPPNKKSGFYINKSDSELTLEEKETIAICESLRKREVRKERERARSGEEDEKENDFQKFDSSNREKEDCYIVFRRDLGCAIWVLRNRTEYNRLIELVDMGTYYSKLLFQYGFNAETGEWNLKLFPVTQTDAQMKGIKSDIDTYTKAFTEFDEYSEYLARKYNLDLDETEKYDERIIYHQLNVPSNELRDMKVFYIPTDATE